MSAHGRSEPVPGGSLVQLQRAVFEDVTMLCRAIAHPEDSEAQEWVQRRAALGTPNEQIEQMREEMAEKSRRARRLSGLPVDAHADLNEAKRQHYEKMRREGKLVDWRTL